MQELWWPNCRFFAEQHPEVVFEARVQIRSDEGSCSEEQSMNEISDELYDRLEAKGQEEDMTGHTKWSEIKHKKDEPTRLIAAANSFLAEEGNRWPDCDPTELVRALAAALAESEQRELRIKAQVDARWYEADAAIEALRDQVKARDKRVKELIETLLYGALFLRVGASGKAFLKLGQEDAILAWIKRGVVVAAGKEQEQ
jgi:hypothetical protein